MNKYEDAFKGTANPTLTQIEIPESTKELLRELLAQNRLILEANCMTMRILGNPTMQVSA